MERWIGRVALVTGASSGIGAAVVKKLVKQGIKVAACARNQTALQEIGEQLKSEKGEFFPVQCDVKKEEEILGMFEKIQRKYGRLDICINSAGVGHTAPLCSGKTELWKDMIDVNVIALSICTREAIQLMKSKNIDDGHIIQISSLAAYSIPPGYDLTFYGATKAMVKSLCDGLRSELATMKSGIKITSVSPGLVKTNFAGKARNEESAQKIFSSMPSLKADDVADAVIYALNAPSYAQVDELLIRAK